MQPADSSDYPSPVVRVAPLGLPADAQIQRVAFSADANDARPVVLKFQEPRVCRAVLDSGSDGTAADLTILLIPVADQESPEAIAAAWNWLEPEIAPEFRQGHLITLQGTRVLWTPGKGAILAPANRLEVLRLALVEFAFYDQELRAMEAALAFAWPELEADTPLAFQFDDRAAAKRPELAARFQRIVALRAKLARMTPVVHRPPVHPPTLASQLAERLRERTRTLERLEWIGGQLEVFERVYEMCSQRTSDYALSQESKVLEWVIILLLATETIVLLVGLMANSGT